MLRSPSRQDLSCPMTQKETSSPHVQKAGFFPGSCMSPTACIHDDASVHAESLCQVQFFATPWPVACQAPQSMGFPRQVYWSGLRFPLAKDLPESGIKPSVMINW